MRQFIAAAQSEPKLAPLIAPNLDTLRRRHLRERAKAGRPLIGVCGWDLAHNAAGRVHTLAQLHARYADVEIIGCLFPRHGSQVWGPLRYERLPPVHAVLVNDEERFLKQAVELVAANPYDIVHLSKPRMPNVFIGLLYQLLWGARVVMDIDDEERAFVTPPIQGGSTPRRPLSLLGLDGREWTDLAASMATAFDAVTVANPALWQRYGGLIVPHARDESTFTVPSPTQRWSARQALSLPLDARIVLFLGTPRRHKGLLELARALAVLARSDTVLAVFGDFADADLRDELLRIHGLRCELRPGPPISKVPHVLAAADCVVLLQDGDSLAGQFQSPAKLVDCLAMGLPTAVFPTPAIADILHDRAVVALDPADLLSGLQPFLDGCSDQPNLAGRRCFESRLSLAVVAPQLQALVGSLRPRLSAPRWTPAIVHAVGHSHSLDSRLLELHESARVRAVSGPTRPSAEMVDARDSVRALAFFLPQYHPIAENDANWGPGFTEWTNVRRARPRFVGHAQPLVPGEFGYYDLRDEEVLVRQSRLAAAHGVSGFCFYYYRFGARRVLETPLELYRRSARATLPFCFCWANESWTRAWDGRSDAVLLHQSYDRLTLTGFVEDIASAVRDDRYVRVQGRPLVLIYQAAELPDGAAFVAQLRTELLIHTGLEPLVGTVHSPRFEPAMLRYLDFVVQFPPHRMRRQGQRKFVDPALVSQFEPKRMDYFERYDDVVEAALDGRALLDGTLLGVCPDWDNSARRASQATILLGSTPKKFEDWVASAARLTSQRFGAGRQAAPIFFVNAWNEWGEGAILEPSHRTGRAYLEALRAGLLQATESTARA